MSVRCGQDIQTMFVSSRVRLPYNCKDFKSVSTLCLGKHSEGLRDPASWAPRDGEVPSQKELSSYFEELFSSKVPCQKELSSSNEELFPNPGNFCMSSKTSGSASSTTG